MQALSHRVPGGSEKDHKKPLRITGVPAEIRTEYLPDTNLERYRYVNLLDDTLHEGE
jgi:hypothetical protein